MAGSEKKIVIVKKGPYLVCGDIPLSREIIVCDRNGTPDRWEQRTDFPRQETYALCRCGRSGNMPYCDGTHKEVGFEGVETASRKPYFEEADLIEGPGIDLFDIPSLCVRGKILPPWR